jgi:hypothetical protein
MREIIDYLSFLAFIRSSPAKSWKKFVLFFFLISLFYLEVISEIFIYLECGAEATKLPHLFDLLASFLVYFLNLHTMTNNTTMKKIFFTIMAFTQPKLIENDKIYSVITSSHYFVKEESFNFNSIGFYERLNTVYKNKLLIIYITNSVETIEAKKIGNFFTSDYSLLLVPEKEFYSESFIKDAFIHNKDMNQTIFVFENLFYGQIVCNLALFKITTSGGSNSKKHILSPIQLRLARFVISISDFSGIEVATSFHIGQITSRVNWKDQRNKNLITSISEEDRNSILFTAPRKIESPQKEEENQDNNTSYNKVADKIEDNNMETNKDKEEFISINKNSSMKRGIHSFTRGYHTTSKNLSSITPPKLKNENILQYYLKYIDNIINHSGLSPFEAQSKMENVWIELIEQKFEDENILIKSHSNKLHNLLFEAKKSLDILEERKVIKRKFNNNLLNNSLNKLEFILLTFVWCITYSNRLSYTAISRLIGDSIIYHIFKKSEVLYGYNEFKNNINYTEELQIKLGDFFINLLSQFPHDIFERKFQISSFYTKESVTLSINHLLIEEIRDNLMINPNTLPMLCKPNFWSENSFGGYLENETKEVPVITGANLHNHKIENKNSLFKAINIMNSIKFGINNTVLNYLNNEGKYLLDSIPPENIIQREIIFKIAQLYSKVPFYLNVHADWRGRIYTQSFFITYQGGDLSSALLNFWEGESLDEAGIYHLYVHGANNHNENNISKESFENRIQWVKNNYQRIINLEKSLILSAENPFVFLAFCLNMKEIDKNPKAIINTPVFLDATCSGIQHLAALLLDLELGISVNLSPYNQEDKPNDIYSELLYFINKAINKYGEEDPRYANLSLLELNRNEIKNSVMTKVYNVSRYGISKQLESKFKNKKSCDISLELINSIQKNKKRDYKSKEENYFSATGKNNKTIFLSRADIFKIAEIINDQIFVVYPSLNNIYSYLLDITKILIKLGIPLTWITPAGLKITQRYLKSKPTVISTKLFNETKKIVLKEYLEDTDKLKQSNAIIPNIIHSLDATHLIFLINNSENQGFGPIITVHDCFGTHPNKMDELVYRVKKEFILLYSQDNFLLKFHDRIIQSILDNNFEIIEQDQRQYILLNEELIKLPLVPKLGELDLKKIIDSKYMIT